MQDIVLEHISKSFDGKEVLSDFSAVFSAGRVSCLMAPSGYGKTTLLRILLGLEKPDSGCVRGLEGCRMAAVFQEDRLCSNLSAQANIRLVNRNLSRRDALDALAAVGLADCGDQSVAAFSGGMKRRVALLRALLAEYDVLVLDEPFKGFDEELKAQMIAFTLARSAGRTVLLVTHDPSEAEAMHAQLYQMEQLNA